MRQDLLPSFALPFYRAMIARSGFGADIERFDATAGDVEAMHGAVSAQFLEQLTAVGDERAVQAGVERYRAAGASSPCVGPIAKSDFAATLHAAIGSVTPAPA